MNILAVLLATATFAGCTPEITGALSTNHGQPTGADRVAVEQARQQLAALPVRAEDPVPVGVRDRFPHWSTVSPRCDTREVVLQRDGQNVQVDRECQPTSGMWVSPYDGAVWVRSSDVDIDHMVPLAEAWASGAGGWPTERREAFANDLVHPQLVAVTDNENSRKSDREPLAGDDGYRPPLTTYWCTYATDWVAVKHAWDLTADAAEVAALDGMLDTCAPVGSS